ncbi:hypothetical protein C8Q80DRAFT_918356 [Daedaleopsis nitida]|nr:hypothetical protein C8Q80DRAFT_918356 [Daedaleopsis nitida]
MKATLPYFDVCISEQHPVTDLRAPRFPHPFISAPAPFPRFHWHGLARVRDTTSNAAGARSSISQSVQLYAKVDLVRNISKNNFRPPPKVESSVVHVVPRNPTPPVEFGEAEDLGRSYLGAGNKLSTRIHGEGRHGEAREPLEDMGISQQGGVSCSFTLLSYIDQNIRHRALSVQLCSLWAPNSMCWCALVYRSRVATYFGSV